MHVPSIEVFNAVTPQRSEEASLKIELPVERSELICASVVGVEVLGERDTEIASQIGANEISVIGEQTLKSQLEQVASETDQTEVAQLDKVLESILNRQE